MFEPGQLLRMNTPRDDGWRWRVVEVLDEHVMIVEIAAKPTPQPHEHAGQPVGRQISVQNEPELFRVVPE